MPSPNRLAHRDEMTAAARALEDAVGRKPTGDEYRAARKAVAARRRAEQAAARNPRRRALRTPGRIAALGRYSGRA